MALKLYPPGTRKGNKTYILRGSVNGRVVEKVTDTTNEATARRLAVEATRRLKREPPALGPRITLAQAAELYKAFKRLKPAEVKRLEKVVAEIGTRRVAELKHADLVEAANRLFPGRAPGSLNRQFLTPAASVLHY